MLGRCCGPAALAAVLLPLLLAATALANAVGATAEEGVFAAIQPKPESRGRGVHVKNEAEAAVAERMITALTSISEEILGKEEEEEDGKVQALSMPDVDVDSVDANSLTTKIFASALSTWHMAVIDAPTNRGLRPEKFLMYDRYHYYQIPENPIGTLVIFHGCVHDASGNWPYDPVNCPECLGLPEEVAHTKQALAYGLAVLAVESKNRDENFRCFAYSSDPNVTDSIEAPIIVQEFIYTHGLQVHPIYTIGVSSGASFAIKFPRLLYQPQFYIKVAGAISEVNAIEWDSWGLINSKGVLRFPGFPPVAYIAMENDPGTKLLIGESIRNLRNYGIPSDFILVKERPVTDTWFYDRSPVITAQQSAAIVQAMRELGLLDEDGYIVNDPRLANFINYSKMYKWNQRLVQKLPWLHLNPLKPPILSVLSDRSTIYEEMNVAFARHEIIADHLVPCLAWLQSNGTLDLQKLSKELSVTQLRNLTSHRIYRPPPPPRPPRPPRPPPSPPASRPPPPQPGQPPRGTAVTGVKPAPPAGKNATGAKPAPPAGKNATGAKPAPPGGKTPAGAKPAPPGGKAAPGGKPTAPHGKQTAPGKAAPGKAAPGKAAPGKAAPGKAAPGKAAPGKQTQPATAMPGNQAKPPKTPPGKQTKPAQAAPGKQTKPAQAAPGKQIKQTKPGAGGKPAAPPNKQSQPMAAAGKQGKPAAAAASSNRTQHAAAAGKQAKPAGAGGKPAPAPGKQAKPAPAKKPAHNAKARQAALARAKARKAAARLQAQKEAQRAAQRQAIRAAQARMKQVAELQARKAAQARAAHEKAAQAQRAAQAKGSQAGAAQAGGGNAAKAGA